MWFPILFLCPLAIALEGFEPLHAEGGCSFSRSVALVDGYPILRAECDWPDVAPERLHSVLGDWAGHQRIWSMVVSSTVVEDDAEGSLVVHVHEAPAMVDREITLRMWSEELPDGRVYRWTRAVPQPAPREGRVGVARDDGMYMVTARGAGVHLVSTLHYDPGGSIPAALVRWFQVLGMPTFLAELKAAALRSGGGGASR